MRYIKLLAWFLIVVILAGCWSRREIEELGFVMGMGISKTEAGLYSVVVQIANPAAIVAEAPHQRDIYTILTAEGLTVFDALRNLSRLSARRLYIAHIQTLIFHEAVAKKNLGEVVGFLVQDMEVRLASQVFISKLQPREIFDTPNTLGIIPSLALEQMAKNFGANNKIFVNDLHKTVEAVNNPVTNYVTTLVEKLPPPTKEEFPVLKLTHIAVFDDDKLVGYLNEEEGQGFNFITSNFTNGLVAFQCSETGDLYTIEILQANSQITPRFVNGNISFDINLTVEGNVAERISTRFREHEADIHKLEGQLNQVLWDKLTKTVDTAQNKFEVDFFNLSRDFSIKYPQEFKSLKDNWNQKFSKASINISVESTIIHQALNLNRGRI